MNAEFIVMVAIGFVLVVLGVRGTFYELGHTDDKQYGKESTKRMFTSLALSVWGLSIVMFAVVLHLLIG